MVLGTSVPELEGAGPVPHFPEAVEDPAVDTLMVLVTLVVMALDLLLIAVGVLLIVLDLWVDVVTVKGFQNNEVALTRYIQAEGVSSVRE